MLNTIRTQRGGFTLVEIMIVVAIIALLAAIAVPNFLRARKRSQATRIIEDMRIIDSAVDQYAIETGKATDFEVGWPDVQNYIKTGSPLYNSNGKDLFGNTYGASTQSGSTAVYGAFYVDGIVTFSNATFQTLSDAVPPEFWSPYIHD